MGTRQILLLILFGVHWLVFLVLLVRRRTLSLLLPLGVFTLLILTQLFWQSPVHVHLGPLGDPLLRTTLRAGAIILAIPSLTLMFRRIQQRRSGQRGAAGA